MSRRPTNQSAENTARNQQTLKTLLKIESNKSCADCKRNKHPRWASWNLGIFVCIRCSGIHRGMGTHISRVRSVDLDTWTEEQLRNMLSWGNARANIYWEAKLAPGHVPAEAKIENFIRTKYELKRWVMEGGMPDPSTLEVDEGQQSAAEAAPAPPRPERTLPTQPPTARIERAPPAKPTTETSPFGHETASAARVMSAHILPPQAASVRTEQSISKQPTKPADSLLGFDFFGSAQSGPPSRPSSAGPTQINNSVPSRPDLKQSILSLYASSQKPVAPPVQQQSVSGSFGDHAAPSAISYPHQPASGYLDDAFSSLSLGNSKPANPHSTSQQGPTTFANLTSPPIRKQSVHNAFNQPSQNVLAGGNFFNSTPSLPQTHSNMTDTTRPAGHSSFGDFSGSALASSGEWSAPLQTNAGEASSNQAGRSNTSTTFANPTSPANFPTAMSSPFNLSEPTNPTTAAVGLTTSKANPTQNTNPWGSTNVWQSSTSTSIPPSMAFKSGPTTAASTSSWGWGDTTGTAASNGPSSASAAKTPVHVAADEDFGGWESSTISATPQQPRPQSGAQPKSAGNFAGAGDDLFSNVWE